MKRELTLKESSSGRLDWQKSLGTNYLPPVYSFLSNEEWRIIDKWYLETEQKKLIGECGVAILSVMLGFIMGNRITNILQLGHYAGYSTLLLGFMLRHPGGESKLVTLDVDEFCCKYTQGWVNRANLQRYVTVLHGSSTDDDIVHCVRRIFNNRLELVFIDSSHEYGQPVKELDTWFKVLSEGGFIFLHDSSKLAASFDATNEGGVKRAIDEWYRQNPEVQMINISASIDTVENRKANSTARPELIYKDPCGLCIIQKQYLRR